MARLRTHPGEVLRKEYLIPLGMSARALAKELGVPANRLAENMRPSGRSISAENRGGHRKASQKLGIRKN